LNRTMDPSCGRFLIAHYLIGVFDARN